MATELMDLVVPAMEASDHVFRYAWYSAYDEIEGFQSNLNVLHFETTHGVRCKRWTWLGCNSKDAKCTWKIGARTKDCYETALSDRRCYGSPNHWNYDDSGEPGLGLTIMQTHG